MSEWQDKPDRPGVWAYRRSVNDQIWYGDYKDLSGDPEWQYAYVGPVPSLPKKPATDKEIADAARRFVDGYIHGKGDAYELCNLVGR